MSDNDDGESAPDFEYGDSQEVSTYEIVERAVHRAGLVFPHSSQDSHIARAPVK
jgi:hypothetical protein